MATDHDTSINFTDDFSSEIIDNVPETAETFAQKIKIIQSTSSANNSNKTYKPINNHAPVFIYHRIKPQNRSTIESCINCSYCNRSLSYKGCKRYSELTSELAVEQFNHEMIKLNKRAAESYADLASQIAQQQAIINQHYEKNMLFPEQNKLVFVEISGCTLHTLH